MLLNGFDDVWKKLQSLTMNEELQQLNEFADYDLSTPEGRRLFEYHYKKHGIPLGMTRKEYREVTDILTSYPAVPFGKDEEYDVVGYVAQNDRNVKFIRLSSGAALGVYEGDPITGTAIDYYHDNDINATIFRANPFRRLVKGAEDLRYKSDLDGKFKGLKCFKPLIGNDGVKITREEYITIKDEILNEKPISIK